MKIGIDARLIDETGVGRYLKNLLFNLPEIDRKNEYYYFFLPEKKDKYNFRSENIHKETLDVRWHSFQNQIITPKMLKSYDLDLVHFPYFDAPIFYGGPFVTTIHDLIIDHFPTGKASQRSPFIYYLKRGGYKFILSQVLKKAKKVIAPSNTTKKEILAHYKVKSEKVKVIYEGITSPVFLKSNDFPFQNLKPKKYFLYVGNAYPHKNLDYLVDCFELFFKENETLREEVKLVFAGKLDYFHKRLKQKVEKKKLEKNIIFTDYVTDEYLSSLYQNALALIFPSKMEGFGLPVLEALSNNCPVIASDIPVIHEIAGEAVVYFNHSRKENLVQILQEIIDGKINLNQSLEKKEDVLRRYSVNKMVKETLAVYENCLSLRLDQ